jgi:hypothetical protein
MRKKEGQGEDKADRVEGQNKLTVVVTVTRFNFGDRDCD